ncbi:MULTISPECIES: GspH/FimT family pseudopilin [Stenotrophomonas]|uniref:GspH/FimT family pseudopilin n=1 Tax=Stenotrophomonas TaxID=40323 RepID=UPI001E34FE7A|nr:MULTISPECIES: GspH/FimT family pseudopilin [Stenotrophomonas]MCE4073729.1 GspH/FimT family pseudopilin [Stenotrophomonas acidaminiphila]
MSLVEILVGAFILVTLAIVALPSMEGLIERQRTRAATYALLNNLALARLTAVSRRGIAALCPSTDGTTCTRSSDWSNGWLLFLDRDGNRRPDTPDDIVRQDIPPASRHIRVVSSAGRRQVRYLPDGRSAGSNLTISLCNTKGRLLARVIVNNAGRARTARPRTPTACPR